MKTCWSGSRPRRRRGLSPVARDGHHHHGGLHHPAGRRPYWFGQIAAANSLSDVYAMGGRPITGAQPRDVPVEGARSGPAREILRGGNEKVLEAGACLAGGHSVDDNEPKYGLAVTGVVHPDRILTNAGARPGDALVLTKPLGTGVLFNANRSGKVPYRGAGGRSAGDGRAERARPCEVALRFRVHACTDITGFGIIGHSLEMARGADVRIELVSGACPFTRAPSRCIAKGNHRQQQSQPHGGARFVGCETEAGKRGGRPAFRPSDLRRAFAVPAGVTGR